MSQACWYADASLTHTPPFGLLALSCPSPLLELLQTPIGVEVAVFLPNVAHMEIRSGSEWAPAEGPGRG